jgi:hypothetical protein
MPAAPPLWNAQRTTDNGQPTTTQLSTPRRPPENQVFFPQQPVTLDLYGVSADRAIGDSLPAGDGGIAFCVKEGAAVSAGPTEGESGILVDHFGCRHGTSHADVAGSGGEEGS